MQVIRITFPVIISIKYHLPPGTIWTNYPGADVSWVH